jgi:hypothetical protein
MRLLTAAVLFTTSFTQALAAEPDLTPSQEEWKAKDDEANEPALKALNEKCGSKATLKTDFQNLKNMKDWTDNSYNPYGFCANYITAVASMCDARPAYKKALGKKLTAISCTFVGAKAKTKDEEKGSSNDFAQKHITFKGGTFTVILNPLGGFTNIDDNVKAIIEKALN